MNQQREYTSRATWKLIQEILESGELYTPAMDQHQIVGDFTAETMQSFCEDQSVWINTSDLDTVDWQQVAEEINGDLNGKSQKQMVYIVMSTNDNASEDTVHGVYLLEASAFKAEGELQEELDEGEALEEDMESPWHVWIEERELQN